MKKSFMLALSFFLLIIIDCSFAKPYTYPVGKPVFSIEFPDSWIVELNTQDVAIYAHSPDKEIEYDIWALPEKDVNKDIKAALNDAVADVNNLLDQFVKNPIFGDWNPATKNDIEFLWAEGEARYKDGNQKVYIEVDFFSPDDKTVYVLVYWGTKEGEQQYKSEIVKIDKSIKKVK